MSYTSTSHYKSVLITGVSGFLGSHLAESILVESSLGNIKEDYRVIAIDNFCTGLASNVTYLKQKFPKNFLFIEKDVIQPWDDVNSILTEAIKSEISHVFHFASPASPPHYQRLSLETLWVNTLGLSHALRFADDIGARVIFSSTSEVYGDPDVSPQPENYWGNVNSFGPRACYDEAKRFGEALIYSWNLRHQTKHGLVRIFNTYGPRMNPNDGRVIINFLVQALAGQDLTIYGDGRQTRSFCFVADLINGIKKYALTDITFPVNFGNDREFTVLELAEKVQAHFAKKQSQIVFLEKAKDDPAQRRPDLSLAKKLFPEWGPKVTLEEGLSKTAQWLQLNSR